MNQQAPLSSERRSFFGRLEKGAASLAAIALGGRAIAQVKQAAATRWEPARHPKDDWLDDLGGLHRLVLDTTTAEGVGSAVLFAGNFVNVNQSDYGVQSKDLAIVLVLRHGSTAFGFNDAMWAKYGAPMAARSTYSDPKTKPDPTKNAYRPRLDSVAKQGVQMAVCSVAARFMAGLIAQSVGGDADAINAELLANLVSNARMVPAGIVAVNRAQERGYSLVTAS